jgi:hypothetical protein
MHVPVLVLYENILFLKFVNKEKQSDFQNSADMIAQDEVQSWTLVKKKKVSQNVEI